MPFLLIRHGSVDYDSHPGRFRGHGIDLLPLSAQGVSDAEALAVRLGESGGLDLIATSSMARAMHTAMIICARLRTRVEVELDLHEWVPDLSQLWSDGEVPRTAYEETAGVRRRVASRAGAILGAALVGAQARYFGAHAIRERRDPRGRHPLGSH